MLKMRMGIVRYIKEYMPESDTCLKVKFNLIKISALPRPETEAWKYTSYLSVPVSLDCR